MAEFRIFGKEVQLRISRAGAPLITVTAIKNFTFEVRQRIVSEQYLGESSARQDEIFDEVGGTFTIHPEGADIMDLQKFIADRARRRVANEDQVTLTFRAQFPSGPRRITVPDCKFDPIPFNVSGRDAYVEMSFTYKADRYSLSA